MGRRQRQIPDWIKFQIPGGETAARVKKILVVKGLNTICVEARCPNIGECFDSGTATFLILGALCTRNCRYCAVQTGTPLPPDPEEPQRIAEAVALLDLSYVVITSVTRDDLEDGGARHFIATVAAIREAHPSCQVELLVPDFGAALESSVDSIIEISPAVINHNIEVVRNYYRDLRPKGNYSRSLQLIERVSRSGVPSKSGLMIGFGEEMSDIIETLQDLRSAGCTMVTIGQYLQSKRNGYPVMKYYHPDEFLEIEEIGRGIGFEKILAGPLVRSSYRAKSMAE